MSGHSEHCKNTTTYWDRDKDKCVPCERPSPGREVTPNCGHDDRGGVHQGPHVPCPPNTFNDGTSYACQPCTVCRFHVESVCVPHRDTVCKDPRFFFFFFFFAFLQKPTTIRQVTTLLTTVSKAESNQSQPIPQQNGSIAVWVVPVGVLILFILCTLIIFTTKRKRGQCERMCFKRRPSFTNPGFAPIVYSARNSNSLEDLLSDDIMAAPLQTVLDNLDVLEELVILLDPDTQGIKSTKHLASHCSFPSTWITYTYSMKESKSPLRAVLEGVASRNPDSTVGHLARLLKQMDRNDAVAALAKLKPGPHEKQYF
ncbi:IGF-like family receptor 1 [Kryptolebias marmoratus]|uniref:IGF-like family receptor 1 n=1 Tax=Kryptolebias marmoratus TaxID=37003 RepID=UPI0018ACE4CF|nr:IGF-like family receptor 1 [Kryptolebias marmoratus]